MFARTEKIMGTDIEILIPEDEHFELIKAQTACDDVYAVFQRLEQVFSRFRKDSELSQLNASRSLKVSQDLLEVLTFALAMAHKTDGLFNPLVRLARLGYSQDFWSRHFEQVDEEKMELDYRHVCIDTKNSSVYLPEYAAVDLGGCAKGYAVDKATIVMDERFPSFVINAGGDMFVRGHFMGDPWQIGVAHPEDETRNCYVIEASDIAIATSGAYRRKWQIGNHMHHHLVSGRDNKNLPGSIKSATVTTSTVMHADAYATIAFLLGEEAGLGFLLENHAMGYFV